MVKRDTILINSFNRKSGVHPVMILRQILFRKAFKTPLSKIGELVITYNVTGNNDTRRPKAFYLLYIVPINSGTGHVVFKV